MKFEVTRASLGLFQGEKSYRPCQEARRATLTYIIRGTKEGDIKEKRKAWVVAIRDFDELMAFVKKYTNDSSIVIERADYEELEYEIVIQDEPF